MKIESLSRELYIKFEGEPPPVTMRGIAITDNDNVLAVLAVAIFAGENFIICGVKELANKRLIIKGWHQFKESFMNKNKEYYALIDDEIKTAHGFLKHFGFEPLKENIYIYRG